MSNLHHFPGSSSLIHCDYDDEKQIMEIRFTSGQTYRYPGVSKEHYEALKKAESPGKHFHTMIRKQFKHEGAK